MFFNQKNHKDESEGPFARGLKNIGNTCFLNSVLQAISSCPPFIKYLCDLDPARDIPFTLGLKNCLRALRVKAESSFMLNWTESTGSKPFDTTSIFDMIMAHNSNFNGHDQQDAQELLQTVFAMLSKERDKRKKRRPENRPPSLGNIAVQSSSRAPHIDNPFEGWITSDLVCQCCRKHRPLKHQVFTDISLPVESLGRASKKSCNGATHNASSATQKVEMTNSEAGPLNGGLPPSGFIKRPIVPNALYSSLGLNLRDCLSDFMKEEDLQQDVECQSCSWTETLKAFQRKSGAVSMNHDIRFTGQHEEEKLNEIILKQFKSSMPEGKLDSCSLDLDDVLFSTDIDADDTSSIADSISLPQSVRSNIYTNWRMRNGLGLASMPPERTTKLDSYLVQKVRTKTRKQLILSRPPGILCLHICRRVGDAVTGRMKKLNQHVSFPGVLDISDYVNSYKSNKAEKQDINNSISPVPDPQGLRVNLDLSSIFGCGSSTESVKSANQYLLRSVIVHTGSSEAGHYSTYCLMSDPPSPKRWMYFSDEQVRAVPEEDVLKSQAYMLFYERSTAQTK